MIFFEINDRGKYQSFASGKRIFHQDWEWGRFQQSLGKTVRRYAAEENGAIVCAGQAVENEMRGKKYLYFPYGPICGRPESLEPFLKELRQANPAFLFARIEPQNFGAADFLRQNRNFAKSINLNPHKTLILDLAKTEAGLLSEMKQKTRYNIKLAEKKNLEIRIGQNFEECAELIVRTAKRAGVRSFPAEYFLELRDFFSQRSPGSESGGILVKFYSVWQGGDLLAANIMLYYGDTAFYLFGGSSEIKREFMAPHLLHWRAICDSKAAGLARYDFWGVEENKKHPWRGFSRFKLGFGGEILEYAGTYDYIFNKPWYNAYKVIRKLNRILR